MKPLSLFAPFASNVNVTKVTICHQTGNPAKPCQKVCINPSDLADHLAHGDFVGNCTPNCVAPAQRISSDANSVDDMLQVMPNPSNGLVTVMFSASESAAYQMTITDITGKLMYESRGVSQEGINEVAADLNSLSKGIYQVRLISDSFTYHQKIVMQ